MCVWLRSDAHGRWLTSKEALIAQSFPVYKDLSSSRPMCSFAVSGSEVLGGETYRRTAMIEQAGNAMHAMIAGMCVLYAATEVERPQQGIFMSSSLLQIAASLTADF